MPQGRVVLDATVADDGLPIDSLVYRWTQAGEDSAPLSFGSPDAEDTTVTATEPGTYVLRLTVSDHDLEASDEVVLQVLPENQLPVIVLEAERSVTTVATMLEPSVSDDGLPEGAVLAYQWTVMPPDAPVTIQSPNEPATRVHFAADGEYTLTLVVTDGEKSASASILLHVLRANAAPSVSAGPDHTISLPTASVVLTGSADDDGLPSGSSVGHHWEQVSGPGVATIETPEGLSTRVSVDAPGTYLLRLTATDGTLSASDDVVITVLLGPKPATRPVADITSPGTNAAIIGPTDVTGTATSESLLSWRLESRRQGDDGWNRIGSGTDEVSGGLLGALDPTLLLNGLHELRLTVIDTGGQMAQDTVMVVVKENRKVGHFSVAFTDLEVPLAGMPIRLTRTYDTRDKSVGDFGYGWNLDVSNVRLAESGQVGTAYSGSYFIAWFSTYTLQPMYTPLVTVTLPDGKVLEFEATITPSQQQLTPIQAVTVSYRARPGTLGKLEPVGDGQFPTQALVVGSWSGPMQLFGEDFNLYDPSLYRLTLPDGRALLIDQVKGLQSLTDLNGNRLTYTPNGIQHSAGKGITFTRDDLGRITRVADPDPETPDLVYAYDAAGDLESFTDRDGNETTFGYDLDFPHYLSTITDPLGRTPIRNDYYPDGRIWKHTDARGEVIEYQHDLTGRQELVTDREGGLRVLHYDERGNVIKEIGPDGRHVDRTFDSRNNRLSETEPYDPTVTPEPRKTVWTFDAADNVQSVTNPKNETTSYTYNARRQVLTIKDPRGQVTGKVTENVYDLQGNLTSTKDALDNVTSYVHDAQGNVRFQIVTVGGVAQTTEFQYNRAGNLISEIDAAGHVTSYGYDGSGNRRSQTTSRTLPDGTVQTLVTSYEYDHSGRLTKTIDPDNTFTRTVYDELGRQKETYDKLGRMTTYQYDEMGRLLKTTYPDTTFEESTYDAEGRRKTSRDRGGRETTYEYDDAGRLKKTIYADETFTESVYDDAGRLTQTIDARLKSTFFGYDDAGRRTSVKDPLENETVFQYDANGNQTTVRDARLNTTTSVYDDLNRRTKTIFPDQTFTETTYDELGRRVTERDQAGKLTQYRYDALGRLVKVIDADLWETTYGYDELGNRVSQTDANLRTTRFEYDKLGRETKRCLPDDLCESKTYDAAGRLLTRSDFRGVTTTYAYEPNTDRLLSRTYKVGELVTEVVSFSYYPTGRRKTMTDSTGTTSYEYDVRDRLSKVTVPSGDTIEYTWDANGNRLSLTTTVGGVATTTSYSYDDASRLDLVTDWLSGVTDHEYDPNGNRRSLTHFNGVATTYGYSDLNRLTSLSTVTGTGQGVQGYAFELGPAGNRTKITEMDGTVRDYGYDNLYRLTSETISRAGVLDYAKVFEYDPVGNRTKQTTARGPAATATSPNALVVDYQYDERDRLTLEQIVADGAAGIVYTYDDNGNTTSKLGEATYVWDAQDRLVRVEKADGTVVEHQYNGDGVRVRTTTTPAGGTASVTNFLVDTSRSLSHVVAETDAAGNATVYYVRSDDELIEIIRPDGAGGWTRKAVHSDGIGSIRKLTDEAGNVTDSYEYSAFGELLSHAGSDTQPYAFAGEPLDPNVGWQHHRARWMDMRVGRFAGMDPWRGEAYVPGSLHRYIYADGDPGNRVDPTGLFGEFSLAGITVGLALLQTAAASSLPTARIGLAAVVLRPTPDDKAFRQLVGVTFAESSSEGWGGEDQAEKRAIAATFLNRTYYYQFSQYNRPPFGDFGPTVWESIRLGSDAAMHPENNILWRLVMLNDDLKPYEELDRSLSNVAQRIKFNRTVEAVASVYSLMLPIAIGELNGSVPVWFRSDDRNPSPRRAQEIGALARSTFWGFRPGRELQ